MPNVVIISKDKDFADAVAEQVESEFSAKVAIAATKEDGHILTDKAAAVITTERLPGQWPVPVVAVEEKDKPIRISRLLAELRRALGRQAADDIFALGKEYVFSLPQKTVTHAASNKAAALTDKEAELLLMLVKAAGKSVSRDALLKDIWDFEAELESHTLETHMYRLRTKLRDIGLKDALLAVEGGYVLEKKS